MNPGSEIPEAARAAPRLPRRLLDTFFSPGKMVEAMASNPRWVGALLVSMVLVTISTALLPPELMVEVQRRAALARGVTPPPMSDRTLQMIRYFSIGGSALAIALVGLLMSGIYTFIFAFILGDEGRFKQYFAVFVHAMFIPTLLSLPLVPLRIQTGDPQFSLSLASFLFFLEPGYLLNVFRFMDLLQLWSTFVVALGAHAIDRRRSVGSALTFMLVVTVAFALIFARFMTS
ncbi:MAG: hypothetical protein FJ207_03940 [Gemmatimonadetes bacterium]|nr:hypothetical protein [Gemmatimonadota bacterium]